MNKNTRSRLLVVLSLVLCLSLVFCAFAACDKDGNSTGDEEPAKEKIIVLTLPESEMCEGETFKIVVKTEYAEASGTSDITAKSERLLPVFESDNESVATVSNDGWLTAVGRGTANIKVKLGDLSASGKITVVGGIELNNPKRTVDIYNADGLASFSESVNEDNVSYDEYKINIKRDIDFENGNWDPLDGYNLVGTVWNGDGHTISNFTISSPVKTNCVTGPEIQTIGFVAACYDISFKNIVFDNVTVNPTAFGYYAGIVLGYLDGTGVFENVTVKNSAITTVSRRGTGAIVGFNNDQYELGGNVIKSSLTITGCSVENVAIESERSAALCGRVCHGYSANVKSNDVHSVILKNNVVKNCTISATVEYTPGRVNFTVNDEIDTLITEFDASNVSKGNKFFFDNVEYIYSNGVFTEKVH